MLVWYYTGFLFLFSFNFVFVRHEISPWTLLQQIFVEYNSGKKFKFISNINGWDFLPDISNKCKRLSWKPGYFFQVVLFLDSYQRPRGEGWKKYKQQWPIFFDKLNLGSHRRMRIVMDQSLSAVVCNHISLQCSMSMSNLTLHLSLPVGEKWKIKYWFHKLRWLWIFRLCQNLNLTFHILWR